MRYTTRIISIPRTTRIPAQTLAGGVRRPQVLGPQRSFGFGDRLGLATSGHVAAVARQPGFMPVFAQQSPSEAARTGRTLQEVMICTTRGLAKARCRLSWGADADHLKTPSDVERAAAAGFTHFTINPVEYINGDADLLSDPDLAHNLRRMIGEGDAPPEWTRSYAESPIEVAGQPFHFETTALQRLVVKFGRALAHVERMAAAVARACADRQFEIEVAINESAAPTTPMEHLYLGLEMEARRVRVVGFAPRLLGGWELGIDYEDDLGAFEAHLRLHASIAAFCGPYKLSIHGVADKWSVLPIIGASCGDLLHVKMGEGSYLEALRVVCRANPLLFEQIVRFCASQFAADRGGGGAVRVTPEQTQGLFNAPPGDEERRFIDERTGRQLLSVTYGSVLTTGRDDAGTPFKQGILDALDSNAELYSELIAAYFARHMALLAGR